MAYLSDRLSSRICLFLICSILTNVMTGISYFSNNFLEVLMPRIIAAISVSAITPISVSLINEYFNKESLGRANSIYVFGMYIGFSLSSLVILVDREIGWRSTTLLVGCFGVIISLSVLFL